MRSILQLSDLHLLAKPEDKIVGINTDHYFQACIEQAIRRRSAYFDLILLTGDLAQEPSVASYQRILNRLESYQTPCICLPGNHDDFELMQQILNSQWVSCRKQTVLDNWQLICLNSQIPGKEGGFLTSDELQFLQDALNPDCHVLIAIHHHCLATNSPWMDTMIIENNQALWAIVNKYPQVKAITTGHIHQVMDRKVGHVRVLGVPSTCYQFTPESSEFSIDNMAPGYRIIELFNDGRIESEVMRLEEPLVGLELEYHGY